MEPTDLNQKIAEALANPRNMGEMQGADAVGSYGNSDCGDMVRMWVKFTEKDGRKIIDRATFQTFGCETAIAVASVATEMISGRTVQEALDLSSEQLSAPLGPLPPMKIHCAQLVEGALRSALGADSPSKPDTAVTTQATTLFDQLSRGTAENPAKPKMVFHTPSKNESNAL